jgi:putative Mn2+ efflux pump MntP
MTSKPGIVTVIINESLHGKVVSEPNNTPDCPRGDLTSSKRLTVLGIATSIDALAAGISLVFSETSILAALLSMIAIKIVIEHLVNR